MRTIKFRGRRIDNSQWVTGDLLQNRSISHISNFDNGVNREHYEVEPNTVGQFTGLHDKNGKEIYEGDIVKTPDDKPMKIGWAERYASFVIDRDGWAFAHYFGEAFLSNQCEIIGNIYENPELLKP